MDHGGSAHDVEDVLTLLKDGELPRVLVDDERRTGGLDGVS